MICNLNYAVAIDRKSVVARCRNVCAENGKTLRRKQVRLRRLQVKHWLPRCAEKVPGKRQHIWRPRTDCHDDEITREARHPERSRGIPRNHLSGSATGFFDFAQNDTVAMPLLEYDAFHTVTAFV